MCRGVSVCVYMCMCQCIGCVYGYGCVYEGMYVEKCRYEG